MSGQTKIEWCTAVWNPVTGCSKVSEGCRNCWACRLAATRLKNHPRYSGVAIYPDLRGVVPEWTGEVRTHPELLDPVLRWRKCRRIFVCSQADLFHEQVSDEFIAQVRDVMVQAKRHIFLVLTKRPERMRDWVRKYWPVVDWNIWLGGSAEDQQTFDKRWKDVRPLAEDGWITWASLEPLLGPIVLPNDYLRLARWTVTGGESGPDARPAHPDWFESVVSQCVSAKVPIFVKQLGGWPNKHGGDKAIVLGRMWHQFPEV